MAAPARLRASPLSDAPEAKTPQDVLLTFPVGRGSVHHGHPLRGKRSRMRATSSGQIVVWQGGSLWIGETRATTRQTAHPAIQVPMALEGDFRLRDPATPEFGEAMTAAIVAANQPHAFSAEGTV